MWLKVYCENLCNALATGASTGSISYWDWNVFWWTDNRWKAADAQWSHRRCPTPDTGRSDWHLYVEATDVWKEVPV